MSMKAVRNLREALVAGLAACSLALPARADALDASVHGQILDSGSGVAVFSAEVELIGTALRTTTDKEGRFVLPRVPPGTHSLKANRLGYEPIVKENIKVEQGEALELPLQMRRKSSSEIKRRVADALALVKLEGFGERYPRQPLPSH